jgi:hypothetical protein
MSTMLLSQVASNINKINCSKNLVLGMCMIENRDEWSTINKQERMCHKLTFSVGIGI